MLLKKLVSLYFVVRLSILVGESSHSTFLLLILFDGCCLDWACIGSRVIDVYVADIDKVRLLVDFCGGRVDLF